MKVDETSYLEDLIARVKALTPETERRWGTLSAGEMLCHVADVNETFLRGKSGPKPGSRVQRRRILKWLAFNAPLSWSRGWKTDPGVDPKKDGTSPGDFAADQERLVATLRAVSRATLDDFGPNHYLFGPMTARDWHMTAYRHCDYHLHQFGM